MDMEIDMVSPLASSFGHPLESAKSEAAKVPKRKKSGKAGRASFTLKLPKFEDPSSKAEFMMYTFKVALCTRRRRHTWSGCPYAHPGETARRRDPRTHCAVPCPEMKQGQKCPRGDRCPYSHHDFEYWLHPTRYRTVACNKSGECGRALCFFYHGAEEQRTTSSQTNGEKEGSPMLPCAMEDPNEHNSLKVGMGGENPPMHCLLMEEGGHSDDGEGDSVDSLMGSLLSRNSFKSNSFNSSRSFTKSHSFTSTFSSPSQTSGTPRQVAPGEHLRSASMRSRVPVTEKLASMQIQSLLANAVKLQSSGSVVGRGSPASLQGPGACPSLRSHGSGSPTSTHASAIGGMSDEMMDSAGGGVAWGATATSSIAKDKAAQMSEFLARRQSAPVMGMTYEALQWLGSGNGCAPLGTQGLVEERDAATLQGLLMSRGSTPAHPNWALNSARSTHLSPRHPLDGGAGQITGLPTSTFGIHADYSQTGFVNNGGIVADQQTLSSPFVTSSSVYDMMGQTRLAPCLEIAQPQIQTPQLEAWDGRLNSSFSADIGGGQSTWGAIPLPTASSCLFPGVLRMEGQ